jgi:hypothetical protein
MEAPRRPELPNGFPATQRDSVLMGYIARRRHAATIAQARLREIFRERAAILRAFPALRLPVVRSARPLSLRRVSATVPDRRPSKLIPPRHH